MYCIIFITSFLSPIVQIQDNSHILGVYSSPQRKIDDGVEYLRIGFEEKNDIKCKNLELIILDISKVEDAKFNKLVTTMGENKKTFSDKRIFFIWPSESVIENFLSREYVQKKILEFNHFQYLT
jgi:hypothetical protein